VEGDMRIGGVSSANNTADILTKNLQPPLHAKHCAPLHILNPTIAAHNNTLHNMAVFAKKTETPKQTKQQKRRAKKQRKRERDYRLLAHARTTLKHHYQLSNQETANISHLCLLDQMHNDRHFFASKPNHTNLAHTHQSHAHFNLKYARSYRPTKRQH
jgi:hypothetical protein